jgi:signal transduction histidine kinase
MDENTINVLLIEDNPADARLIGEILSEESSVQYKIERASRLDAGLARLAKGGIDAALLDLSLPDSYGIDTFNRARAHAPHLPIVVLTGLDDQTLAAETLRAGGQDYLNKGISHLCVLHQTIRHAIERNRAAKDSCKVGAPDDAAQAEGQFLALFIEQLKKHLKLLRTTVAALTDENGNSARLMQSLAALRHQVEQEVRLVDDVQTYSSLGRQDMHVGSTECDAVVDCALSNLQGAINEAHAVITRDPLPAIVADSAMMARLFENLIGSAIDLRGRAAPNIKIAAERKDGMWVFSVRNEGVGLTPEDTQRAFAVFQGMREEDGRPYTGVGLAICRKIVERHGGSIWAESELRRGSCFYFAIPARSVD